ncbi:MAG: LamG domain-containing protein, partial [Chloroflexaceae bacterium]|nr:LamG domain-containing protein [Chloroflexaceae bacterium]
DVYKRQQIDPYGWFGPGPDPCAAYAGCLPGEWLWSPSLIGAYNFTPPGATAPLLTSRLPGPDQTPPAAAITVAPPEDLLFAAEFDGHLVQRVGRGFPQSSGIPRFGPGRAGQGLEPGPAEVAYPLAGNLDPRAGTVSLWAELPDRYPDGAVPRHYLFAASANPHDAPAYRGTMALRRDNAGPDGAPAWVFWTTGTTEASRDLLAAPDTLGAGWHHLAITWDANGGRKALYVDGVLAAETQGVELPTELGEVLRLGRFAAGGRHSGARLDDLAIYNRALGPAEIAALAGASPGDTPAVVRLSERAVRIDTNALDDQGGIMAVQFGLNGIFEDPQPYYDAYRWTLPVSEGRHVLAVRFSDRSGNSTTLTRTIELNSHQLVYVPLLRR